MIGSSAKEHKPSWCGGQNDELGIFAHNVVGIRVSTSRGFDGGTALCDVSFDRLPDVERAEEKLKQLSWDRNDEEGDDDRDDAGDTELAHHLLDGSRWR